jgi:hypothetical protein
MEFPARNERHATQQKKKKQRGKELLFQDFNCKKHCKECKAKGAGAGYRSTLGRLLLCPAPAPENDP